MTSSPETEVEYPAFFGGPLTAALLGIVNGRRLALGAERLGVIGGAGLFAAAVRVAMAPGADVGLPGRWS